MSGLSEKARAAAERLRDRLGLEGCHDLQVVMNDLTQMGDLEQSSADIIKRVVEVQQVLDGVRFRKEGSTCPKP